MKNFREWLIEMLGGRTENQFKQLAEINDNHQETIKELQAGKYRGDRVYVQKEGVEPLKQFYLIESLDQLDMGDIVRHKSGGNSYVVNVNFGDRVTASDTKDITNINEWLVLGVINKEETK